MIFNRPKRPSIGSEAIASRLFFALSPRLAKKRLPKPPQRYRPYEEVTVPRSRGYGNLSATFFPAREVTRGAALLIHPWLVWGRAYFHRRGRIEALRRAGYDVLTIDLPGLGDSGPAAGFFDRDIDDALTYLRLRTGELPLHLWGISAGGYWAHPVLSRANRIGGAMFEDVSCHLFEWSVRMLPWGRPFFAFFKYCLPAWYRFLDLRAHAPALQVAAVSYVSGQLDPGVLPEETRHLAELANASCLIVDDADHLESIKRQTAKVIELALATFARAEALGLDQAAVPPDSKPVGSGSPSSGGGSSAPWQQLPD